MSAIIRAFACLVLAVAAVPAAALVDLDLARLRALPEAPAIRARLLAALPAEAAARLAVLREQCGLRPDDLARVVVDLDGPETLVRLVGLPARRIADRLAAGAEPLACAGHQAWRLPRRPQVAFVALGDDQALIGRVARLAELTAIPDLPARVDGQALVARLAPPAAPRLDALRLVRHLELHADGAGHLAATVTATDGTAAAELERRLGVLRTMAQTGADGRLPVMADLARLLAAATVTRDGADLRLAVEVPADLRAAAIERVVARVEQRLRAR